MTKNQKYLCVYCGSRTGASKNFAKTAQSLGQWLGKNNWGLVYGGGNVGLMGVVAKSALQSGAPVIGVIPEFMLSKELALEECTELIVVKSMHERKFVMAERSHAFVALPGGFGTYDEFFEMVTWAQLGLHQKPILLFNELGFYSDLLSFLNKVKDHGFISEVHHNLIRPVETLSGLAEYLEKL